MFLNNKVKNKGMTLVEVLMALAILIIIMVAITAFEVNVITYNRSSQTALINTEEAENILKKMNKELRIMVPSANGSYAIANVSTSTMTFFADVDGNGVVDQVRYYLATTTLYRGTIVPSGNPPVYSMVNEKTFVLATGIRNASSSPVFEYYDGSYDGSQNAMSYPVTITQIRLVKVNMTIDSDPRNSPLPRTFSTQASLRNLKDNL